MIPKAERGQYDLIGSVWGCVRYLRDQALKAQAPDYAAERARFIRARADLAEMEAEEKRGFLLAADQVETAWIALPALVGTLLLALPDRLPRNIWNREGRDKNSRLADPLARRMPTRSLSLPLS